MIRKNEAILFIALFSVTFILGSNLTKLSSKHSHNKALQQERAMQFI